jgi:hypothetical protein
MGLPGTFIVGRLPGMGSPDSWVVASIAQTVVIVAGIGSFLPARRAPLLNPETDSNETTSCCWPVRRSDCRDRP